MSKRPYLAAIKPYTWNPNGESVPGLILRGRSGLAAHVTKAEAYELADQLVDAADSLPDAPQPPKARQMPQPCYASNSDTLTAADGTPEEPLPATSAE